MRQLLLLILLLLPLQSGAATVHIDLQPVGICTAAGCAAPDFGKNYLRRIWAQADIGVRVRKPVSSDVLAIRTDAAGELDASDALYDFAYWQMDAGLRAGTAYIGFTGPLSGRTVGMAFVNGPGLTPFPYGISESLGGRYGAVVVAHELGHILGAQHDDGDTLMSPVLTRSDYDARGFLPAIGADVFHTVHDSPLLTQSLAEAPAPAPVPLPPAAAMFAAALLLLAGRARPRRS